MHAETRNKHVMFQKMWIKTQYIYFNLSVLTLSLSIIWGGVHAQSRPLTTLKQYSVAYFIVTLGQRIEQNVDNDQGERDLERLDRSLETVLKKIQGIELLTAKDAIPLLPNTLTREHRSKDQLISLGGFTGRDWVFSAHLEPIGPDKRLELRVYDIRQSRILAAHQLWAKQSSAFLPEVKGAVRKLMSKARYSAERAPSAPPPYFTLGLLEEEEEAPVLDLQTPEERLGWALSQVARRELDEMSEKRERIYKKHQREKRNALLVIRAEEEKDWAELQTFQDEKVPNDEHRRRLLIYIENYQDHEDPKILERVAEARNRYTWLNRDLKWVRVRGGRFLLGSSFPVPDEWPIQWVSIKGFEVTQSEITNAQYQACVDAGACKSPHWDDNSCLIYQNRELVKRALPTGSRRGDMPVVCISWRQAKAFARWTGGRLLSESEWEFLARSGDKTYIYPWGKDEATCERAVMSLPQGAGCGAEQPWPVCSKSMGINSMGLCDLAGNVWEWVEDSYAPSYERVPTDGSPRRGGGTKVIRGGAFTSDTRGLRASTRGRYSGRDRANFVGFRVARAEFFGEE